MASVPISYPESEGNFDANFIRSIFTDLCYQPTGSLESDTLEIKGWCHDERELAEKVSEAAACLANAGGGLLLVGVSDEEGSPKKFSPCPYPNVTRHWLTARIHDSTYPPVECSVQDASETLSQVLSVAGRNVFVIQIPKKRCFGAHLTAKGVSKIRVGKECRPHFSAEDDFSKIAVLDLTEEDLSLGSLEWGMAQHRKRFDGPRQWSDPWEFLTQVRLIEPYLLDEEIAPRFRLSLAALLLFGKQAALARHAPHFETVVIAGGSTGSLRKNIIESVREICSGDGAIMPHIAPFVEADVLMELLVNAYVHRCYRIPGPIVVRASQSGLEIQSPGELPGGLRPDDLINCVPVYRNLLLSEGARFVGLCDKVGQGIDLVYRGVLAGGLPFPEFESENGEFVARIPLDGSSEFREFLRKRSQALTQLEEIMVLRILWTKDAATLAELSTAIQRRNDVGTRVLESMVRKGMAEQAEPGVFRLSPIVRRDIQTIFRSDQLSMDKYLWGN